MNENMKFELTVKSRTGYAVSISSSAIGITDLDMVRDKLGLPDMSAELLQGGIDQIQQDINFGIDESVARESGHFKTCCVVAVRVPAGFINDRVDTDVVASRDEDTDAITGVRIVRSINNARVLAAWINAGYPLEWGTETNAVNKL